LGVARVPLASNAVSVQLNLARAGAGLAIVHDFALARRARTGAGSARRGRAARTFWLVSHAGPARRALDRVAALLRDGMRAENAQDASVDGQNGEVWRHGGPPAPGCLKDVTLAS
jgi:DNA-binding transcriptional LysR family regulator